MANPFKYIRGFSFSGWQATRPTKPLPGPNVDDELSKVSQSIGQVVDAIADVRRADGKLKNQIVTVDSLASDLSLGLRTPTRWMPSTGYLTLDTVFVDLEGYYGIYRCQKAHTSGASFPADLAAGRWEVIFSLLDLIDQITPAQTIPYVYELANGTSQINLSTIPGAPNITVSRFVLNGAEQVRGTDKDWYMDGATTLRLVSPIALDDLGLTSPATATVYVTPEGPLLDRFDDRYVKEMEVGRGVGNVIRLEDTDGAGLPTIRTDSRIIFAKAQATANDPYQFGFIRNAGDIGGSGVVNANVAMYLEVANTTPNFQWNLLTSTTVKAGSVGGGEHVNAYFQANKFGDSSLWGMCLEFRDHTTNPGSGSVGMEFGFFVNGPDNNKLRHALDFSFGGVTNDLGDNIISTGIRMGPSFGELGRMVMRKGIELSGRVYEGIDLSGIASVFNVSGMGSGGDRAIILNANGKTVWRNDKSSPDRASFGWLSTEETFAFGGVKTYTGAVTPILAYEVVYINGAEWLRPMYQRA